MLNCDTSSAPSPPFAMYLVVLAVIPSALPRFTVKNLFRVAPESIWFPFASILTACPLVCVPVVVTNSVVFPETVPTAVACPP